jgi:hypothetical protein
MGNDSSFDEDDTPEVPPIVVDADGHIVDGSHRREAYRKASS